MNNKYFCKKCGVVGEAASILSEVYCPFCSLPMLMDNSERALANDSSIAAISSTVIFPFGFCDLFSIPAGSDFQDYEYLLNNVIMSELSFEAVNSEKYKELMKM